MKYQVDIPTPSAKRLKNIKLVVESSDGWMGYPTKTYALEPGVTTFEFEVANEFEHVFSTSMSDGPIFYVYVEFSNDIGSRVERTYLTPKKVS